MISSVASTETMLSSTTLNDNTLGQLLHC